MVTIWRDGASRARIIPGDHVPPHVHIETPDGEVCLNLLTGDAAGRRAARRSARAAIDWVAMNREALLRTWKEING